VAALLNMSNAAWKRQPSGVLQANTASPLLRNIVSLCDYQQGAFDVFRRSAPTIDGTVGITQTSPSGIGSFCNRVGSDLSSRWVCQTGLLGTEYTLVAVASLSTLGIVNGLIGYQYGSTAPVPTSRVCFQFRVGTSNNVEFIRFNTSFSAFAATSSTVLTANRLYVLAAVTIGNNLSVYVDGSLTGTATITGTPTSITDANYPVVSTGISYITHNNSETSSDARFKGTLFLTAVYNKAISDQSLAEIGKNPWQLFTPAPRRFYLIPSSGGAASYTSTFSLDSFIQKSFSQTTTLDALLQATFSSTISLDSLISAVQSRTISLDAILQVAGGVSVSVDALLQTVKAGTLSVDALLQATLLNQLSLDAFIQKSKTQTASFDALLQAVKAGTTSLDALITGASGTLVSASLDALIQAIQNKTLSLDALIQKTYTSTLALDAYVALVGTKTVSLDALLQMTKTGTVSFDAIIQATKTQFVSFDALIQAAKVGTISLDAILTLATMASVFLDAFVQKSLSVGVSLDAIIGAIADMILPTGRVIQASASDRIVASLPTNRLITTLPVNPIIL